jgi:hypothetical protein
MSGVDSARVVRFNLSGRQKKTTRMQDPGCNRFLFLVRGLPVFKPS